MALGRNLAHLLGLAVAILLAYMGVQESLRHVEMMELFTSSLDTDHSVERLKLKLMEWFSFGGHDGFTEQTAQLKALEARALLSEERALYYAQAFWAWSAIYALPFVLIKDWRPQLVAALIGLALIALAAGLIAPVMMVIAYKEVPVLGEVVFQFRAKSVLSTISAVWERGHILIGSFLLLFSVITPVLKSVILIIATLWKNTHQHLVHWVHKIGKWSMADVFVVSMILAFFAMEQDGYTDARIQAGLYYFLAYVVLSLLATHLASHAESDHK